LSRELEYTALHSLTPLLLSTSGCHVECWLPEVTDHGGWLLKKKFLPKELPKVGSYLKPSACWHTYLADWGMTEAGSSMCGERGRRERKGVRASAHCRGGVRPVGVLRPEEGSLRGTNIAVLSMLWDVTSQRPREQTTFGLGMALNSGLFSLRNSVWHNYPSRPLDPMLLSCSIKGHSGNKLPISPCTPILITFYTKNSDFQVFLTLSKFNIITLISAYVRKARRRPSMCSYTATTDLYMRRGAHWRYWAVYFRPSSSNRLSESVNRHVNRRC
jgi:hypothetical protein